MKNSTTLLIVVVALVTALASAVGGALIAMRSQPAQAADSAEVAPGQDASLRQIARAVEDLARGQEKISERFEELDTKVMMLEQTASRRQASGLPVDTLAAATGDSGEPVSAPASGADEGEGAWTLEDAMEEVAAMFATDMSEPERQEFWQKVREAGLLDEVVEAMEDRVEADPQNADLRVEMGETYLQKIFEVGGGPLAGVWASKADGAFDVALELQPEHWDARFNKAVSLSFWPPVLGKQGEAIQQFEMLIDQQSAMPAAPQHAQTFLLLGNMHQQSGNMEKALEVWNEGLSQFPDNDSLAGQVKLNSKG